MFGSGFTVDLLRRLPGVEAAPGRILRADSAGLRVDSSERLLVDQIHLRERFGFGEHRRRQLPFPRDPGPVPEDPDDLFQIPDDEAPCPAIGPASLPARAPLPSRKMSARGLNGAASVSNRTLAVSPSPSTTSPKATGIRLVRRFYGPIAAHEEGPFEYHEKDRGPLGVQHRKGFDGEGRPVFDLHRRKGATVTRGRTSGSVPFQRRS